MFYAKAMYRGGETIVAADHLSYSSYTQLGLRCIACGEEVCLRKGIVKSRHFAHFMDVGSSPSNCPLRVRGFSDSWSELTVESKGQRRHLFQEYFLSIIKKLNTNFVSYIQRLTTIISINKLELIVKKFSECFCINKTNLINEFRSLALKNSNQNLGMQFLIASEAIDYLSISSSQELLEQLIYYSIYLCYSESSLSAEDSLIYTISDNKIVETIKNIILETNWLSNFEYFSQKIKVSSGEPSKPQSPVNPLNRNISKSIETYFDINVDALIITYKKYTTVKLKFDTINVKLYTMQILGRVGKEEKENYRYFKTLANITKVDIISNHQEIVITWRLIYDKFDKDIINLYPYDSSFLNFLGEEVLKFLKRSLSIKRQYKYNKYKKVNFILDTNDRK
ncbi:competence protein CoiA family protein [Nostoc sp.]|uniref:competence protein CoiA family protein n=1 Tax=Nostoc sp. TaxID=1180 RepID=UPI002FFC9E41